MKKNRASMLLIEDDRSVAEVIKAITQDHGFDVHVESDGLAGLIHLRGFPNYDLVMLDWQLPGLDGLSLLKTIKKEPALRHLPVIMETAQVDRQSVKQGIQYGAYHYLTKPLDPEMLLAVLDSAMTLVTARQAATKSLTSQPAWTKLVEELCVRFRTLDQARELARVLADLCPEPNRAFFGFWELMSNAVEHGNLGMNYQKKMDLIERGQFETEIESRLLDPVLGQRWAHASLKLSDDQIELIVQDEGDGFKWEDYLNISPERAFFAHGRGIATAHLVTFEFLQYQGNGNTVSALMSLNSQT